MLFDLQSMFSDDQEVTVTAVSENVMDLGSSKVKLGKGTPVPIRVQVTEDFEGLTSLQMQIRTSATETGGALDTPEVLYQSQAIPLADLVAGYVFEPRFMPRETRRYVDINYVVVGTATAGKIKAGVVPEEQSNF